MNCNKTTIKWQDHCKYPQVSYSQIEILQKDAESECLHDIKQIYLPLVSFPAFAIERVPGPAWRSLL
jgi:hypothetical protein